MTPKLQNSARVARRPIVTRRQAGFSLVELMISMLIGLVIIGALVTLFVNTSGNNRELARANSMIENGRFAIKVLEDDLAHAGYWSGWVPAFDDQTSTAIPGDVPLGIPDPCQDATTWDATYRRNLMGLPLQVYDDAAAADLATCVVDGVIDDYLPDTDVLVVRHADTCVPGEGGYCEPSDPDKLYIQASYCDGEDPYVFDTSGFMTLTKMDCVTVADSRKFVSNIYYIRDYAVTPGDGIPTLVRSEFNLTAGGTAAGAPAGGGAGRGHRGLPHRAGRR